ncbi:MAG: Gfo/Idh/MocA family oxidoreductase [Victivallales bacterium]|nr:Gfo/Idh/MocA family oxidoreductase [Victivallales bacterium]
MTDKLKVAIAGLAHVHAVGFYSAFKKYPEEVDFIGITDIPDKKGAEAESLENRLKKNFRIKSEMPRIFDSLDSLLAEKPDLVCIGSDIADHAAVAVQCLQHGVNAVIEKPMALKIQDGLRMLDAARKSTASLFVNWPIAWFPAFNVAKQMVDDSKIGRPLRVVY